MTDPRARDLGTSRLPRPIWLNFWTEAWTFEARELEPFERVPALDMVRVEWLELVPSLCVAAIVRDLRRMKRRKRGGKYRFSTGRLRKPWVVRAMAENLAEWGVAVGFDEIERCAEIVAGEALDRRLIARTLAADGWVKAFHFHRFARWVRSAPRGLTCAELGHVHEAHAPLRLPRARARVKIAPPVRSVRKRRGARLELVATARRLERARRRAARASATAHALEGARR